MGSGNCHHLLFTNLLLFLPLLYYLIIVQKKTKGESALAVVLVLVIVSSQLFWSDPVQQSNVHLVDSWVAKTAIFAFILYVLRYKFHRFNAASKVSFFVVLAAIGLSFYFSNFYSSREWCSNHHVWWHGCLHVMCCVGTFYAFL